MLLLFICIFDVCNGLVLLDNLIRMGKICHFLNNKKLTNIQPTKQTTALKRGNHGTSNANDKCSFTNLYG